MIRSHRARRGRLVLAIAAVLTIVVATPVAAQGPPGNNGTVKVHDAFEAEPEVRNEPHVSCGFHLHFFFADAGQTGAWWIESWPPTGSKETVMGPSTYGPTDASGEWATGELTLPAGHYKVFWNGRNAQNVKHKVFWVEPCDETVTPPTNPPGNGGSGQEGETPRGGTAGGNPPLPPTLPDTAMSATSSSILLALAVLLSGTTLALVTVRRRIGPR